LKNLRDEVVKTALEYQLVTEFTSRVAVEEQVTRAPDGQLARANVPTVLPRGWNPSSFFATATDDPLHLTFGLIAWIAAIMLFMGETQRRPKQ
jgi:hypothetical protein